MSVNICRLCVGRLKHQPLIETPLSSHVYTDFINCKLEFYFVFYVDSLGRVRSLTHVDLYLRNQ